MRPPITPLESAVGTRHSMVAPPVMIPVTAADPAGVHHAGVARDGVPDRSAGGGAARSAVAAATAAIAEAIERSVASHAGLPIRRRSAIGDERAVPLSAWSLHTHAQRRAAGFPYGDAYPDDEWLTETFDLLTNEPCWVPAALVSLSGEHGMLATSSGLAAAPTVTTALLRALQELVERDAYVITWLHGLAGREVESPARGARAFDLTPAFSPHPVAAVTSAAPFAGAPRHSIGLACRATWDDAVEKAYLECCQGNVFVGHRLRAEPELVGMSAQAVVGFDRHALFYGANPDRWDSVPLIARARPAPKPRRASAVPDGDVGELHELALALAAAGIDVSYRELTTVDAHQLGLRIVRVVAPALTPLHHDHRWPFLGGRTSDVSWRYPGAKPGEFPSSHPHGLG